jgi:hypothetical protein
MAMQYDVQSGTAAANTSTTVVSYRTRVKGLVLNYASGGTVTIKDGGSSGTTVFSFTGPGAAGSVNVIIPGEGILCKTDVYVTCAANTTAVVFYG